MSRRSLVLLAALYAALAGLVAAGVFSRLDQWAVEHAMPGAHFHAKQPSVLDALVPFLGAHEHSGWGLAVNLVALPAGALVSLAILAALRRWAVVVACLAGDLVELVCKRVLDRPALFRAGFHVAPFDSSFPSGHALRTVVVAGAIAWVWPRARLAVLVWACASIALLLLAGWHTPTDLAGGVLLGALALLCARGAGALRARRLRA